MYREFVKLKECDYSQVTAKMGDKLRLAHAVMGAVCELQEFAIAYDKDDEVNMKEELGDLLFYIEMFRDYRGVNIIEAHGLVLEELIELGIDALDAVKKSVFHVSSESDSKVPEVRMKTIVNFFDALQEYIYFFGYDVKVIKRLNMGKLSKRYKDSVTTKESENRDIAKELENF